MIDYYRHKMSIISWKKFEQNVRSSGCDLFKRLNEFPNSILVTGCQRSGTTMLSRIITQSNGMVNYWFGPDDELDAALILSGYVDHIPQGRYCFQTTYLNASYQEYFKHTNGHKIIWVLRNPFSVVYSMLHNWRRSGLYRLFRSCGAYLLEGIDKHRYECFGVWGVGRLRQACLAYQGKVSQLFELRKKIGPDRLMVVAYEELAMDKRNILQIIYRFIDLEYKEDYTGMIHSKSITKYKRLSEKEAALVESLCVPIYLKAKKLAHHAPKFL